MNNYLLQIYSLMRERLWTETPLQDQSACSLLDQTACFLLNSLLFCSRVAASDSRETK